MNSIQILKEIPSKTEITSFVSDFVNKGDNHLEKFLTLKFLEQVIKDALPKLNGLAKDDFLKTFNGAMKMDIMGVNITMVNMSKSNTLKDPSYTYSTAITEIEKEIRWTEEKLQYLKDKLKLEKTNEINNGTAKKLDEIFEEPKEVKDDFILKISLRK